MSLKSAPHHLFQLRQSLSLIEFRALVFEFFNRLSRGFIYLITPSQHLIDNLLLGCAVRPVEQIKASHAIMIYKYTTYLIS